MIRRGSIVVPTAPHVVHHPWQVEWAKGVQLSCYVGIVVDSEMDEADEWKPKKFPEKIGMSMAVTSQGMSQRRMWHNRQVMSNKVFATGAKTGSAKIHCKAGFGRVVSSTAQPLDEQKGRAEWQESQILGGGKADSVYLVLHRTDDKKWCISWVNEADVEAGDVRIAVIKKRDGRGIKDWFLLQLWKSDIKSQSEALKPLQAYVSGDKIKVTPGTIGNKMPVYAGVGPINVPDFGLTVPGDDGTYILIATCTGSTNGAIPFPSSEPTISLVEDVPDDDDTTAYLNMSTVYVQDGKASVMNNLSGSLWGERMKVTGSPPLYFFNLI